MATVEPTRTMLRTRPIVSEEPRPEIWRLLRLFLHEESVASRIRDVHGLGLEEHSRNVRKQARQVAQSLRQAEEYFTAARSVGLATRPTLLYYGAAALARASILVNLTGDHSFDALRVRDRHQHHGLDLVRTFLGVNVRSASPGEWFAALCAKVHFHEREGVAWGTFPLFYESLITPAILLRHVVREQGAPTFVEKDEVLATAEMPEIENLRDRDLDALGLIKGLPDMWVHLVELQLDPSICPGRLELTTERLPQVLASGPRQAHQHFDMYVNAARPDQQADLKHLLLRSGATLISETSASLRLRATHFVTEGQDQAIYAPDMVDSITGRTFYIVDPEGYVPEPAAHMVLLFSLGMLARYFPDVWMELVERNALLAELTGTVLDVIERKFPNLILDQLTGIKHYVQLQ